MVKLLESMDAEHPAVPCLVLANSQNAAGLQKAQNLGVSSDWVDHKQFGAERADFEDALIKKLDAAGADVICLAGFMRVLTAHFIDRYEGRMLNIHPSLLPKYKGLHTHARAIAAGDSEAGCTVHEVTGVLDTGPLLGQARVPVLEGDAPDTLAARVLTMEHQLYPAVLRRFANGDKAPLYLPPMPETHIKL